MSRDLLDLVRELNTLNDDNLADRVIENSDVQRCLSELQDILEDAPTLTPPNEWASVEEGLPEPGERVLAANGSFVGEAYMASNGAWMRHDGFPWEVDAWMPMPDRRPPEGEA